MSEASRYSRGRKPNDKTGAVNGSSLGMNTPGSGKVTRGREGDWPPSAAQHADNMSAIVPGAKAGPVTPSR